MQSDQTTAIPILPIERDTSRANLGPKRNFMGVSRLGPFQHEFGIGLAEAVYLEELYRWAPNDGSRVFRTQDQIQAATGLNPKRQQRVLRRLEEKGLVHIERGGSKNRNYYVINWDWINERIANYLDEKGEPTNQPQSGQNVRTGKRQSGQNVRTGEDKTSALDRTKCPHSTRARGGRKLGKEKREGKQATSSPTATPSVGRQADPPRVDLTPSRNGHVVNGTENGHPHEGSAQSDSVAAIPEALAEERFISRFAQHLDYRLEADLEADHGWQQQALEHLAKCGVKEALERIKQVEIQEKDEPLWKRPPKKKMRYEEEAKALIRLLNELGGKHFREDNPNHLRDIANRLSEVKGDTEGVEQMLRRQATLWVNHPKMHEYYRPKTLFGKENFHNYYDQRNEPAKARQHEDEQAKKRAQKSREEQLERFRELQYRKKLGDLDGALKDEYETLKAEFGK